MERSPRTLQSPPPVSLHVVIAFGIVAALVSGFGSLLTGHGIAFAASATPPTTPVSKASATITPASLAAGSLTPVLTGTAKGTATLSVSILDHAGNLTKYGPIEVASNGTWSLSITPALAHSNSAYMVYLYDARRAFILKSALRITIARTPVATQTFTDGLHFLVPEGGVAQEQGSDFYLSADALASNTASVTLYANCSTGCVQSAQKLTAGTTITAAGRQITLVSANSARATFLITQASPARGPFGLWRILPADWGKAVASFPVAPRFTAAGAGTLADLQTLLTQARANNMSLILRMGDRAVRRAGVTNPNGTFSLTKWEANFNFACPTDASGKRTCIDLSSYVKDGTIAMIDIAETNGDPADTAKGAPSLAQIKQMAAYVKTLWPYLPVSIDGSHPCDLGTGYTVNDVDYEIINVFTRNSAPDTYAGTEKAIDQGVACARKAGLGYVIDINPLGYTQNGGFGHNSLPTFEHFMDYALMTPGTSGVIAWRNASIATSTTIVQGKKTFVNFWNEKVNPGITAALARIYACAVRPTAARCSGT